MKKTYLHIQIFKQNFIFKSNKLYEITRPVLPF